jgi:hypothetical protein
MKSIVHIKSTVRKTAAFIRNTKSLLTAVILSLWAALSAAPVFAAGNTTTAAPAAGDIGSSKLATGTEALIGDVTSWLLIIAPFVTVVAVIYYLIRKTVSDEIDHKKWGTRITTAIICCIGVVAASVIIQLIISYYQ